MTVIDPLAGFGEYTPTGETEYAYEPFTSEKVIDAVIDDRSNPLSVTFQFDPAASPDSVNKTVYVVDPGRWNAIGCETELPFTVTVPEAGFARYPLADVTLKLYVPLGSENVSDFVVVERFVPLSVTFQSPFSGRPVSLNVKE